MEVNSKKKRAEAQATNRPRKAKFQADFAPAEDRTVRLLKAELQLTSNTDFFFDAIASAGPYRNGN